MIIRPTRGKVLLKPYRKESSIVSEVVLGKKCILGECVAAGEPPTDKKGRYTSGRIPPGALVWFKRHHDRQYDKLGEDNMFFVNYVDVVGLERGA